MSVEAEIRTRDCTVHWGCSLMNISCSQTCKQCLTNNHQNRLEKKHNSEEAPISVLFKQTLKQVVSTWNWDSCLQILYCMTIWLAKNKHQTSLTCLYCGFTLMNISFSWFSFRFSISSLHWHWDTLTIRQRWWQSVQLVRRRGAIMADGYNILFKCDDKNWTFFWVGNINTTKQSQSRHFGETRLETGDFLVQCMMKHS